MLKRHFAAGLAEAGCDEAGRGALAGPVFAAAVMLPADFDLPGLNDSKLLSAQKRDIFRKIIEEKAIAWAIGIAEAEEIDRINIRNASILSMHRALEKCKLLPGHIIVDGNFFIPFRQIPHHCIVRGDRKFQSIAAASILAKTHRDEYMNKLDEEFPEYHWSRNKGYATASHVEAIKQYGFSLHHRKSFHLQALQLKLGFQSST